MPQARATLPRAKKKPINYFQPKDIRRIIQALESEPLKWKTITHLFIVTGARRGEIMGLKWHNVHLDERYIKIEDNLRYSKARGIYVETPKTEEIRFVAIPEETAELLREYRAEQEKLRQLNGDRWQNDEGFLFTRDDGRVMHPDSPTAWLRKFSRRHDLPHVNPHAFRHTVASVLIANHTDVVTVSRQLGHSNVTTTETYYAHLIEESRVRAGECIADVMLQWLRWERRKVILLTRKENCNTIVLQGDDFMAMDATLQIRIDSAVKEQVEALYRNLGTSVR